MNSKSWTVEHVGGVEWMWVLVGASSNEYTTEESTAAASPSGCLQERRREGDTNLQLGFYSLVISKPRSHQQALIYLTIQEHNLQHLPHIFNDIMW